MRSYFYQFIVLGEAPQAIKGNSKILVVLLKLFVLLLFALAISIFPLIYLIDKGHVCNIGHPDLKAIIMDTNLNSRAMIFLTTCLIHPLLEELSFRHFLKPPKESIIASLAFSSAFLLILILQIPWAIYPYVGRLYVIIPYIPALAIFYYVFRATINDDVNKKIISFTANHTRLLIFISSLLFSLFHYQVIGSTSNVFLYFFLFLPYFVMGYIFAFARCWLGTYGSIILHIAYNSLLFSTTILFRG